MKKISSNNSVLANKKTLAFFVLGIVLAVSFLVFFFQAEMLKWINFGNQTQMQGNVNVPELKSSESTFLSEEAEIVSETPQREETKKLLKSENYKIREITFGGGAATTDENTEGLPVKIANLQSEALLSQDNKEARLLISWETNKDALSTVEYSRSDGQAPKKADEGGFGLTHRLVLAGLDPGVVYIYQIKSRDRWGQEFVSEFYSVYSGSPAVSVFDMISKSMNEIFGWAIQK